MQESRPGCQPVRLMNRGSHADPLVNTAVSVIAQRGANARTHSSARRKATVHLALDLPSRTDLAALAIMFPKQDPVTGKASTPHSRCYANDTAVLESRNPSYPGLADWVSDDHARERDRLRHERV